MTQVTQGVVVMAYGTPRHPDEILDYYIDIRRGRTPTAEQLADLTRRYQAIGGVSPLAERTEAQRQAIAAALGAEHAVVLGLKHAFPKIEDAVAALALNGVDSVVGLVLAPHYSAMSVGEYLSRARAASAAHSLRFEGISSWHLEPAYITFLAAAVTNGLQELPDRTLVVFTAHSLPTRVVADGDPYETNLRATAAAVAGSAAFTQGWQIGWQSAGRTPEPWLGPDILSVMSDAVERGYQGVLVCPCGFVADHLEVLYDLDIEAAGHAERLGLAFARTKSLNDDADVMAALARLVGDIARS